MAGYRKVNLPIEETRPTDFVLIEEDSWYSVQSWTRTTQLLRRGLMECAFLSCVLQKCDPETGEPLNLKPITVLVPTSTTQQVMVSTGT
jgi:hypothetical protein